MTLAFQMLVKLVDLIGTAELDVCLTKRACHCDGVQTKAPITNAARYSLA